MFAIIYLLGTFIADLLKSRRRLEVENLFLRHQLNIILRRPPQRLRLRGSALRSHCPQSLRQTPLQWKIIALVKALNVVAIEAFVTDLHPGAQRAHGREAPRRQTGSPPLRSQSGDSAAAVHARAWAFP
jgi:hypothetical protein